MNGTREFRITRVNENSGGTFAKDMVCVEEPLEIRVDSMPLATTMRTPGHDEELAAGFLFSEGIILKPGDIQNFRKNVRNKAGNSIDFFLAPTAPAKSMWERRNFLMNSSCGICGKQSIQKTLQKKRSFSKPVPVGKMAIQRLTRQLSDSQLIFSKTGGLHGAGLFTLAGRLLVSREDVGRHNAVDKLVGWALLGKKRFQNRILMVSGRISFEIVQKAINAGIPVVVGISAPTSLAIDLARRGRMTLIGFARGHSFNVYAGKVS